MKHRCNINFVIALTIFLNIIANYDLAQSDDNSMPTKTYTIVSMRDLSMKALTKNLSDYSVSELKSLPVNIRKEYKIVVSSDISKEDLKATMKHIVVQETKNNPDIDEIVVFAYDREEDSKGAYTFGKMEWCPNGNWDGVTPGIASSNDRSSYKYLFHIKDKVGNISNANVPTKEEFRIYDSFEKALWADPNAAEEIVKQTVARKFGISVEKIDRICIKVLTYKMQ